MRNQKLPTYRYFYDLEFLENGLTIELISIGVICEDGREYYAINKNMPLVRIGMHDFLCKNVVPHLPILPKGRILKKISDARQTGDKFSYQNPLFINLDISDPHIKQKSIIAKEVKEFLLPTDDNGKLKILPELWASHCAYDHVGLCQLWGSMADTPKGIPHYTNDLATLKRQLGNPPIPEELNTTPHHALEDARYDMRLYFYLLDLFTDKRRDCYEC